MTMPMLLVNTSHRLARHLFTALWHRSWSPAWRARDRFNTVWTYDIYQSYSGRINRTSTTCGWGGWPRSLVSLSASAALTSPPSSIYHGHVAARVRFVMLVVSALLVGHVLETHHRPRRIFGLLGGTLGAAVLRLSLAKGPPA